MGLAQKCHASQTSCGSLSMACQLHAGVSIKSAAKQFHAVQWLTFATVEVYFLPRPYACTNRGPIFHVFDV